MATLCTYRTFTLLLLISAVPFAIITSLELATWPSSPHSIHYASHGWFRECAKWDPLNNRFLVSTFFDGGLAQLFKNNSSKIMEERTVIAEADVAGNSSVGFALDLNRKRVVVVYADVLGNKFSAVGAYGLDQWDRIFLTRLSGPDDELSFADDVAVDDDGNAYITDTKANKIWKVGLNGELLSVIRSSVFIQRKEWYYNFVGLNGIAYHPNGYLLVIHTASGYLFKVDAAKEEVSVVKVKGSLFMGDGLQLLSPTKMVVVGSMPSARAVESDDDWETATVTGRYIGPLHRIATAATVKDGKVYINHLVGGGFKKRTHVIAEAVFTPLNVK